MDSSKISNIILDSDDDEMDDIISEFAEEEGKEQVIQFSDSEDEIGNLIEEFASEKSEDEIDNLIEEFASEINNVDVQMGSTSEECSVATANDVIIGDRDCTVICDKNNDNKNIYSDKVSGENSFKDTKESCDSIKSSSWNDNFSSSSETGLSKITPDNYATGNENCVDKKNNPPILILKCESLSSPSISYSCSELSALTSHSFNNVSRQSIPNKSTNENLLEDFECDKIKNSVSNVCNKEVPKNSSTENNVVLDLANDTADNREYIEICDKDRNIYAISSVEILEENSSSKESDSIDICDVDGSSLAINDLSKPSHNMASNNVSVTAVPESKSFCCIDTVEILEENSSSKESDSIDICDVDGSSLTINDLSKPSDNMASNNISVTAVPESKSFCCIDTLKSTSNRVAEVIITPEKLNSEENTAIENNQNLVGEGVVLLENSTCANSDYDRTDDVIDLSKRESHSKCIENLQSNDTKLIAQEPNGVINKDSSVAIAKLNCLKTVTEECVVNTENKTNNNTSEDVLVQHSDVNYSASQIITSPVLCESSDISSVVEFIDNSNSVNEELKISSNIKDTEKNLMSRMAEKIYSEESFLKHREKLIVEIQSFISTAYDSSLKKDDINSIYGREVMDNLEFSGNVDERTSNSKRSSISSDERDLSITTQEGTKETEEQTKEIEEQTKETEEQTKETEEQTKETEEQTKEIEEQTNEIEEKTNETEERTNEIEVRATDITDEGSSDVYVLHQQESSIINESIQASAPEILKSDITKNSEANVIDSKEVLEKGISERNKRVLEISETELSCKRLKIDTKNSETNVVHSKELLEKGISEINKRVVEISENELSCKRLKIDVSSVIDSNESLLDMPEDFNSMKHTNKEELVYEVIDVDIEPVDKINRPIPWNPHWKIEATRKTLDRIALNVSEEFVKKYYETEYSQMKKEAWKLKELVENFTDVTQNLLSMAKEFRSSQKISFADNGFKKVTYRTVGTNVKITKKENNEQKLDKRKAAEKTPGMISDQKQQDVPPVPTILNVSGNISNQKQQTVSPIISIPKVSEIVSDPKQDVSPILTIPTASRIISDQKQQDVPPVLTIHNVSGNISNQKQQTVSPIISIPKVSEIISNQKQQTVSPIISIPKVSEIVSDPKQNVSPILTIPTASRIISDQKQVVSSVLTVSKASEIISDQKKQEVSSVIVSIPKASEISDQKKQGVSPVIVTIPKAFKIISNQKQQKVSPVTTIPKASSTIFGQKQENVSHIKSFLKHSGIIFGQNQENVSHLKAILISDQKKKNVPHIKAIPKVSEIDLSKNSSSSCINLSSSHGGASEITPFIPTPLPYVMEGDRLVPYIEPSKPSSKPLVMPLTTPVTTVTTNIEPSKSLSTSKPLVMPLSTAVTVVNNSQISALLRKQYEQKGAMPNGVLHPNNSITKLFPNVQPSRAPRQATLPPQSNSGQNITNHLIQGNIRRMIFPAQARQLLQMNPTDAVVNLNSAAYSIRKVSAISRNRHGASIGILNHPQKDSQSRLYYQVPRFNPPMPARQISHVPCQSLSVTMTHSSKVMPQLPNLARCHPTYVHKKASPVISHPLSFHYNSASVNQHHPMSYQPLSVSSASVNQHHPISYQPLSVSSASVNQHHPMSYQPLSVSSHNNPLQLKHPPASSSSLNSLPVPPHKPYLPLGLNSSENGNLLPIPIVKGSVKDNGSVVISWDLPSLEQQSNIAFYQLYSCQVKHPPESPPVWKSVGDVASLELPVACTLNHFEENTYYYFTVRVVDKLKNYGPFSEPVTIYYSEKNYASPKI